MDSCNYHLDMGENKSILDIETYSLSFFPFLLLLILSFLISLNLVFKVLIIMDAIDRALILANPYYSWGIIIINSISWTLRKKLWLWRNRSLSINTVISRVTLFYLLFNCFSFILNTSLIFNNSQREKCFSFSQERRFYMLLAFLLTFSSLLQLTFVPFSNYILDRCLPKRWKFACSRGY